MHSVFRILVNTCFEPSLPNIVFFFFDIINNNGQHIVFLGWG